MRRIISIIAEPSVKKDARLNELLEGREEGYTVISAEKLLRKEVENETKQGEMIKKYTSAGKAVPDYIVINTILSPLRSAEGNVIFDEFPTTETQVNAIFEVGFRLDRMINIYTADKKAELDYASGYRIDIRNISLESPNAKTELIRAITEF